MSERLIKPYEISVWEDQLTPSGFIENKLAVIGTNTMTGLNKVYDPVFNKKSNGEKTLSFSLKYKYFDPYSGNSDFINPFAALLVNERKVKLHYDGEWYEFIIKDHTESSDGLEWTYTCTDAFVLELSKNGYNITFDSELNNNQGTARELTEKTLENTDWQVGEAEIGEQLVAEPVYKATLISDESIDIINTEDGSAAEFGDNASIYLFYIYVKNQNGKFIQFIIHDENRQYTIDDNNVITDTNYRITTELTYKSDGFYLDDTKIISWSETENRYQVNRLVYNQLTTYDPVMQRTVDRFKVEDGDLEVYKYTDYTYTTSNVVTNFITNGENFNLLEDGSLQGWNPYVDFTPDPEKENDNVEKLELITRPELATGIELANLATLSQIEGFLKVKFKGTLTEQYKNAVYNSGFENNASTIESVAKGDRFVFRWRAATGDIQNLTTTNKLGLIVAKYTQDAPGWGYYYKYIDPNNIILRFEGNGTVLNNIIEGGTLVNNTYVIDDIVQTPSTKYIYKSDGQEYVWNGLTGQFEVKTDNNYLPYYYLTATAQQGITNTVLKDPKTKIGIFIYHTDESNPTYYIQDIQLTRYVADAEGNPVLLGNIPVATSTTTEHYYIKPSDGSAADDITTYTSINELQSAEGLGNIIPLYNENSEKNLSISVSKSNCFNILQTIAETFECWVDLKVFHDDQGYITYTNNKPNKYVYLKEYAGKDNYAGFKYGINLQSIERTVNSDEVVTKLIVDQSQSEYVDEGFVSISNATSNTSGESYILNFDYYYNQGLLNREEVEADKNEFITALANKNRELQSKEKQRRDLESSLTVLESKRNVFTELVTTAEDTLTRALGEFERLTGQTYEDYRAEHTSLSEDDQLTEEDTIFDLLGEIYTSSATINNYSGLLTNIEQEYSKIRTQLHGSENYKVKIWVGRDDNQKDHVFVELNDYLVGFSFFINGSEYNVTVSKKYFDILINEGEASGLVISFNAPQGYSITPNTYTVNSSEVKVIKILSSQTIPGIEDDIDDIQEEKNQLTNDFNNKYSRFIQEGTWNSTDYIDSELYYLDALQVSNTSAQPTVSYTINVVEISELEGFEWYTFDAGDKTYVEDTEFFGWANVNGHLTPAREEVIVSEVEWHLDRPEENVITVQNYKTRFEDLFQRISAAVQTVQYNEATYAKISSLLDANGTINQDVLLESLNRISGQNYNLTSDGSVLINGDQILVQNLTNPANRVIINSEGIRISSDGGQTWRTAIDGQGINIGTVYTGTLNTQNVVIGSSDNPSFRWDKSGISAYKSNNETGVYDLKTYVRYDEYGLYGIKNNGSFKAESLDDVLDKAHFAVTWDGFFIKNSYEGGGRVEITSDNDFRVLKTVNNEEKEVIKIGALEWNGSKNPVSGVAPTLYGIRITNDSGVETFKTGNDGNITITGTINANAGIFDGNVQVGTNTPHIDIDGVNAVIKSSNYNGGPSASSTYGWMINADGDAVFNNITARGAIKTAVFEYAEIQAVGGVFIFRPSSTIRSAAVEGNDLVLTVEKPILFKDGQWCKVSNYASGSNTSDGEATNPDVTNILLNNGLTHVYQITRVQGSNDIRLLGAKAMVDGVDAVVNSVDEFIGGALVDMGNKAGTSNYGIGINSSDNTVNLPARAISLFETVVDETNEPKVSYNYRGILGTLPTLQYTGENAQVNQYYHDYLEGTQGIYTDNMYLGDHNQYIAFYEDSNHNKQLRIKANQIMFEITDDQGHGTGEYKEVQDATDGENAIDVCIESNLGNFILSTDTTITLTCTVYSGTQDITNQVTSFVWTKKNQDGTIDANWIPTLASIDGRSILVDASDIQAKAIFICTVEF